MKRIIGIGLMGYFFCQAAYAAPQYSLTYLGDFAPAGMNNHGDVVGRHMAWYQQQLIDWSNLGLKAKAINDAGEVVGEGPQRGHPVDFYLSSPSASPQETGVLWSNDINSHGVILSRMSGAVVQFGGAATNLTQSHAIHAEGMAINDLAQVVGWAYLDQQAQQNLNEKAFRLSQGQFELLDSSSGFEQNFAMDINQSGQTVGYGVEGGVAKSWQVESGTSEVNLSLHQQLTSEHVGVLDSFALANNQHNDTVGQVGFDCQVVDCEEQGNVAGFVSVNNSTYLLNQLIDENHPLLDEYRLVKAVDINDRGQIAVLATAISNNQEHALLLTPDYTASFESLSLRGTPNSWQSSPMSLVNDHIWQIDITFGSGKAEFKFDRFGDWSDNYGDNNQDNIADFFGSNITVAPNREYRITFNDQTRAYQVQPLDYRAAHANMHLRGTFNQWGNLPMRLVSDNLWTAYTYFESSNPSFKFDAKGDWSVNWGDNDFNGIVDWSGANIPVVGNSGYYQISFNENNGRYEVEQR
ncbi:MAG: hypothetical protein CMF25_03405 [Kangiellaceae bacterium]|nr:hypothetical protein [Kangiellaceae bacterium]